MKKSIAITIDILTLVLIGVLTTGLILMYRDTDDRISSLKKTIEELETTNKELNEDIDRLDYTMSNIESNNNQNNEGTSYDISSFEKIKASDIAKLSKDETIVIMIGREGCGWCQKYIPVLKSAQKKYKFKTKYIDLAKIISIQTWELIDEDSYNTLIDIPAESGYENIILQEFGATPLTIIIRDNKIINAFAGYVEESELSDVLESVGFSK